MASEEHREAPNEAQHARQGVPAGAPRGLGKPSFGFRTGPGPAPRGSRWPGSARRSPRDHPRE
eukprot:8730162-Pyramimonas_sp.AAC.1